MTELQKRITAAQRDDVLVIEVQLKEVRDYDVSQSLGNDMLAEINGHGPVKVIVDMSQIEFMSSVGYLPYVGLRNEVQKRGGHVVLANMSTAIKEMFEATRLIINAKSPASPFYYADSIDDGIELMNRLG